jgi:predicted alpha/beta-hydrolase family hydrolase
MQSVAVTIPVSEDESVSGMLGVPEGFAAGRTAAVIVAHGAGNDMHTPLLVHFCEGLSRAGYLSLRFNFLYKEKGRKAPDPPEKLVSTWQAAFEFVKTHPQYGTAQIIAAGKSMGGRIASQMTADGLIAPKALIFLGYPLHPPGRKEQLRDAHLYRIKIPMLFFAGTRDALCDLELLKPVVKRLNPSTQLEIIEGGDHSFELPKSFNRLLKNGASSRDPALHGFRKCSHMTEYAALSKTPRALADGPALVFQHPVKMAEETVHERILQRTAGWLKQQI